MPSVADIDTSLAGDPNVKFLGPYGAGDAGAEIIRCRKTVYVPAPYVGLLLSDNIIPVEAWNRLQGEIVKAVEEAACRLVMDWLRTAII